MADKQKKSGLKPKLQKAKAKFFKTYYSNPAKDLKIKGIFNKSIKTIAQVTLLPEALNTFKETIPAGKTVQTVLVFEMTETNANNLTSIVLEIKSSNGTNSVNIK